MIVTAIVAMVGYHRAVYFHRNENLSLYGVTNPNEEEEEEVEEDLGLTAIGSTTTSVWTLVESRPFGCSSGEDSAHGSNTE